MASEFRVGDIVETTPESPYPGRRGDVVHVGIYADPIITFRVRGQDWGVQASRLRLVERPEPWASPWKEERFETYLLADAKASADARRDELTAQGHEVLGPSPRYFTLRGEGGPVTGYTLTWRPRRSPHA